MKANIKLAPKTALYIRTSTNKQDTGADMQFNELTKFLAQSEIEDYVLYEDKGISGAKENRPAFNLMKQDIKKGKVKSVVTYSLSRLGRKCSILSDLRRLLDSKHVPLIMLQEQIDTNTVDGNFMFHIHGAVAEHARDETRRNTIAGCEEARRKGKVWGFKKTRPSARIRRLHQQGESIRSIAAKCNCSKGAVQAEVKQLKQGREIIKWKSA